MTAYRRVRVDGHPTASTNGWALEHRVALHDRIGPGRHQCHWCAAPVEWGGDGDAELTVDHLDHDRSNNTETNLVPACRPCNSARVALSPDVASAALTHRGDTQATRRRHHATGLAACLVAVIAAGLVAAVSGLSTLEERFPRPAATREVQIP